jgi:sucrose-6-phosphate hydrolase SacC (GH32 family)
MNDGKYPGMPFNQQMSCPYEFKLRKYGYGSYRIFALPIKEMEKLRGTSHAWKNLELKPGDNPLAGLTGDLWDICAEIELGAAKEIGFKLRGHIVSYSVSEKPSDNTLRSEQLSAVMPPKDGKIKLRILVDRTTVELFGNDGEVVIPTCFLPEENNQYLELFANGGNAKIASLDVYPLHSIWPAA